MSIRIVSSAVEPIVNRVIGVLVDHPYDYGNGLFWGHSKYNDLLLQHLRQYKFYVPIGSGPVSSVITAYFSNGGVDYVPYIVSTPVIEGGYVEGYDVATYGSFYRNLQLFGSFLTGRSFSSPSFESENSCRHVTYSGELAGEQQGLTPIMVDYDFFGYSAKVSYLGGTVWDHVHVNGVTPVDLTYHFSNNAGFLQYNLLDLLAFLSNQDEVRNIAFIGALLTRTLSNLRYSVNSDYLDIDYHMNLVDSTNDFSYDWDVSIAIDLHDNANRWNISYPAVSGSDYGYDFHGFSRYQILNNVRRDRQSSDVDYEPYVYLNVNGPIIVSSSNPDLQEVNNGLGACLSDLRSNRFLEPFAREVDKNWFDLASSSMFSTVAAFKQSESSVGTDVLQTLAKIPDIVDALPKIREGVDILSRIHKRDLSLATLHDIIDLATSTDLQANFEWRPYLALFSQNIPFMIRTLSSLGRTGKKIVGYGSFSANLNNELGRKEVTLVTRTKMVMDTSSSGLLSAVLGIDALGIIPKPSNLWDLIPFTFVVNWFTGVGKAIERCEYSLLLATIPAYYIHTYTISSPFTSEELELLHCSSTSTKPAGLRLYYRDISLCTPYPRDSRFGFGIPTQLPSVGTLGSLLFQLIFS
jgi:hypothetical protein